MMITSVCQNFCLELVYCRIYPRSAYCTVWHYFVMSIAVNVYCHLPNNCKIEVLFLSTLFCLKDGVTLSSDDSFKQNGKATI